MKLIIESGRVIATASDVYQGNHQAILAPDWFDIKQMANYRLVDGELVLPEEQSQQQITMRQARLLLLHKAVLSDVDAYVSELPEPHKTAAQIEWEYATHVKKDNPIVQMLAQKLDLDSETIDRWFHEASQL